MLKNYFKTAWRNLIRNKAYSAINIGGLAAGMAVAMLIGLWIYDEVSFNKYHKNYDNIAQVWAGGTDPESGVIDGSEALQFPMGAVLKTNYKRYFKHVLMAWWIGDYTQSTTDKKITKKGEFIEAGAPEMLSLKMLKGTYAGLNISHSNQLVGLRCGYWRRSANYFTHGKFPGNKGCHCKPGEKFKNRIKLIGQLC